MFSIEHSNLTETVRLTMTGTYTSPPCPPDNTHPLSARDLASFGQPTVGVFSVTLSLNSLFTQLTDIEQTLLQALCEPVALKAGQMLNPQASDTAAQVYFLTGATVALMIQGGPRSSLAVGLLGSDSAAGLEYALNASTPQLQFRVQTTGHAWGVKASVFRALMLQNPHMLGIVSHHLWQLVEHVAAVAACMQTLDIRARLAAWLVLSAEKAQTTTLHLTHEHLAHMLGVRRVSITLAAGELRDMGLLRYTRGQLHILDLSGLKKAHQPH